MLCPAFLDDEVLRGFQNLFSDFVIEVRVFLFPFIFLFLLILLAITVLIWVLTGSTLITMLTQTALLGFFAAFNVFNLAIGGMGTDLGWGLFVTWAFFTIMYQLTKVGGMG